MSIKKLLAAVTCLLVGTVIPSGLYGQIYKESTNPFEIGYFDHDMQFFAPGDFDEYGGESIYPTGWYFNYQRMYLNASRPDKIDRVTFSDQPTQTDPTWGNRFQLGFMTEENKGWEFQYIHVDGPNQLFVDLTTFDADNNPTPNIISERINRGELHSGEVNRTYRMHLENGAIMEFLIGPRYVNFTDLTGVDASGRQVRNENDIVAGQLGIRGFKKSGRWTVFGSAQAFPGINYQLFSDGAEHEFVIGGEARLEAAFHVTKDIAMVLGYDFLYLGRGIARGNDRDTNDQAFLLHGITFGFQVNMP